MWMFILLLEMGIVFHEVDGMARSHPDNHTLNVALLIPFTLGWEIGSSAAAAIIPATKEIIQRQLLSGYQIDWIVRDSSCVPHKGEIASNKSLVLKQYIDVFMYRYKVLYLFDRDTSRDLLHYIFNNNVENI